MEYGLVARWLVAYAVLGAAGFPVAARLFPRLVGRGVGFALPVALVVLTTAAYWVGHLSFGPAAVAAGVLALAAVAALATVDRSALREGELALAPAIAADRVDRRALGETAAVFVAAFLFLVAVRAVDPAVFPIGGEKFLDFGLLKSLLRSPTLPPEDIWFAGEPVNYYYGGHLMAALLATLTATPPRFAYNLALAGFYAMLVTAAFDLAGAIAAHRGGSRVRAGVAAAFFVGLASNLATATRFALSALPPATARGIASGIASNTRYSVDALLADPSSFSYWSASRVIPGTINEFPLFAWLNGDLHAHMMGTPFLLLAGALGFSYFLTPATDRRRRLALLFVAFPLLGGLQAVVDTWSFPSVFGLAWLAATFAPAHPLTLFPADLDEAIRGRTPDSRLAREIVRTGAALGVTAVAGALAALLAIPFFLGSAAGGDRAIAVLAPGQRSPLDALLLVHGAFLVTFALFLAGRLDAERPVVAALGVVAIAAVALAQQFAVLALAGPLLVFAWVALRMDRPVGYEAVLMVAGAGLVALVEVVYVKEQAGPLRMNTVFKTYMQVWVLWGTAAGVALPGLIRGRAGTAAERSGSSDDAEERGAASLGGGLPSLLGVVPVGDSTRRALAIGFAALLVLSTATYGAAALGAHFENASDPTLDATAFVEARHPGEAPAIDWLDAKGTPETTLLSAPATMRYFGPGSGPDERMAYSWRANPASSLTGVPTVAGWRHEVGYRGAETYHARVREVDAAFTGSTDERAAVLRTYGVEYVWVGPAERARYGTDLRSFADTPGIEVAYRTETVTIYRVNPGRLPGG
jgi:YYY domain-containing protein